MLVINEIGQELHTISVGGVLEQFNSIFRLYPLVNRGNISYKDISIFFRSNKLSLGNFNNFYTSYEIFERQAILRMGINFRKEFRHIYADIALFCLVFKVYGILEDSDCVWISSAGEWIE